MSLYEFVKKVNFEKKSKRFSLTRRKKEAIITFGLKYTPETDENYNDYLINWCLYFTPQFDTFVPKTLAESSRLYNEIIREKFDGHDPVDYSIGRGCKIGPENDQLDMPNQSLEEESENELINIDNIQNEEDNAEYYFEPVIIPDNLISVSDEQIAALAQQFNNLREEIPERNHKTGFISRLNEEQKKAFKKSQKVQIKNLSS